MKIEPYLVFNGRCDEAIEFYRNALGATVEFLMRHDESPEQAPEGMLPPDWGRKVMHASLSVGGATLMASDGKSTERPKFDGIMLSITCADEAAARRTFDALGAGGQVLMPLGKTFWTSCFGMVADRFGVSWMVGVDH
jgi:PhnB protein